MPRKKKTTKSAPKPTGKLAGKDLEVAMELGRMVKAFRVRLPRRLQPSVNSVKEARIAERKERAKSAPKLTGKLAGKDLEVAMELGRRVKAIKEALIAERKERANLRKMGVRLR